MKKFLIIVALFYSASISAQNIAYVSQDSVLATISAYQANMVKIDSLKKIYQEEIRLAKEKTGRDMQKLLAGYNPVPGEDIASVRKRMNPNDSSKLDLMIEEDKFNSNKADSYSKILMTEYKNTVQPILDKLNAAIASYALKNKLDIVYIIEQLKPALAYINKSKDVTAAIIADLKTK